MVTDLQRKAAHAAGRMAARIGRPPHACPFKPAEGPKQRILALWFVRGYRSAQPVSTGPSFS